MQDKEIELRRGIYFLASVILFVIFLRPVIANKRTAQLEETYRKNVMTAFEDVRRVIDERKKGDVRAEDLGDIEVELQNGVSQIVKQVEEDQHWVNGKAYDGQEAVYMVDGQGSLVYFSFHNGSMATTWSGPSDDPDFLAAAGGWNAGKGSGWSGFKVY